MPPVSEADKKRGFVVYSRHYLECVYPHTKPRPEELNPALRLFATPGEFEPMNFVVHPLRDLAAAKVTVSAIGPVPARKIDVRRVRFQRARPNYTVLYRYRVVPDMLEHFDSLDLKAGENARFWLTVRVPDDAPPGTLHRQGHLRLLRRPGRGAGQAAHPAVQAARRSGQDLRHLLPASLRPDGRRGR